MLNELKHLIEKYNEVVATIQKQIAQKPIPDDSLPDLILDYKLLPETPAVIEARISKQNALNETKKRNQDSATQKKEAYQHVVQLMHELRAELMHMEAISNSDDISQTDGPYCFFKHRFEAMCRTHPHWYHVQHYLALIYDDPIEEELEELVELQNRLKHLVERMERMERKAHTLEENQKHEPLKPEFKPSGGDPSKEDEKK